jgi:hypothetical protein
VAADATVNFVAIVADVMELVPPTGVGAPRKGRQAHRDRRQRA